MSKLTVHAVWCKQNPQQAADQIEQLQRQLADTSRAFEIADESMAELLLSEGLPDETASRGQSGMIGLVNDDQQEVSDLEHASEAIQEAYAWLHSRDMAELMHAPDGAAIYLRIEE